MANDEEDLTEEKIKQMERNLLGYDPAKQTVVEVRRSRRILRDPAQKPHVEIVARLNEMGDHVFDFYLVATNAERKLVHAGLSDREAKIQTYKYRVDKVEIRMAR
ncbi:hypothetical protein R1521_32800 [Rhizobium brockwellii]|uniref:Uncharacterized protein n=1 Tax=Rhizobium brockwellii TaxID=3019932 RepID=A0ABU3YWV4_9HYPH|nr:hypothetical protein [Rhizobium brockwellii]MDV4183282.1 hypothetical protein [Rhizobium brockwellii]MDV4190293.1 hypothetical protein [Rhizobium brockwellii]